MWEIMPYFFSFLQRNGELWKIVTLTPPFPSTYIFFSNPPQQGPFSNTTFPTQDPWAIFPDPIRSDFFSFQIFLTFRPQLKARHLLTMKRGGEGDMRPKMHFLLGEKDPFSSAHFALSISDNITVIIVLWEAKVSPFFPNLIPNLELRWFWVGARGKDLDDCDLPKLRFP